MKDSAADQDGGSEELAEVTAAIRDGDDAAFRWFYDRYCDRLYRYLIVLTRGNEDLSRDLLQTTLIKAVRSMKRFTEDGHAWHWLAAIARNGFIDARRRLRTQPTIVSLFSDEGAQDAVPATAPSGETPLMNALEQSLGELDGEERELIEQFYFDENSHQAIAARVRTSPKAVESKLARVRQKIRQTLLRRLKHEDS